MTTKAELYLLTLQELEKSAGNIISSAIVTRDGLIMSSTSSNNIQKETFAAYGAAAFKSASKTMEELSEENINLLIFESENYRVVTLLAGEVLLIALTGKDVQMGMMLLEMKNTAQKVKGFLA
ncbi:Roadblock/LC7 domain protein [uncultured archaeon]|nr:Roadblock/LC7 domain protein [uncultured archaeon]